MGSERHEGSILIVKGEVRPWPVRRLADLQPQDLATGAGGGARVVEVLLLGTGG